MTKISNQVARQMEQQECVGISVCFAITTRSVQAQRDGEMNDRQEESHGIMIRKTKQATSGDNRAIGWGDGAGR